jgi:hypothetical protein
MENPTPVMMTDMSKTTKSSTKERPGVDPERIFFSVFLFKGGMAASNIYGEKRLFAEDEADASSLLESF